MPPAPREGKVAHPSLKVLRCEVAQMPVDDLTSPGRPAEEVYHHHLAVLRCLEKLFLVGQLHVATMTVELVLLALRLRFLKLDLAFFAESFEIIFIHTR